VTELERLGRDPAVLAGYVALAHQIWDTVPPRQRLAERDAANRARRSELALPHPSDDDVAPEPEGFTYSDRGLDQGFL